MTEHHHIWDELTTEFPVPTASVPLRERGPKLLTIPEVRERLYAMSDSQRMPELRMLADQLWRRPPGRRKARAQSRAMTPELAAQIRSYAKQHPGESEHRIGIRFGVNQGRVSEALFGFRA